MEQANLKNCKIEGCKRPYRAKGYCNVHFKKWRQGEMPKKPRYKTCVEENCRKPMVSGGLCEEHYKADQGPGTTDQGPTAKKEEEKKVDQGPTVKKEKVEEKK